MIDEVYHFEYGRISLLCIRRQCYDNRKRVIARQRIRRERRLARLVAVRQYDRTLHHALFIKDERYIARIFTIRHCTGIRACVGCDKRGSSSITLVLPREAVHFRQHIAEVPIHKRNGRIREIITPDIRYRHPKFARSLAGHCDGFDNEIRAADSFARYVVGIGLERPVSAAVCDFA